MSLLSQQAAARSAARQKKKGSSPPPPAAPAPSGVIKTSPSGRMYRLFVVSIEDLPDFLEREKFDPKAFFHYKPEEDKTIPENTPEDRLRKYRSGFVLGVRRKDDPEAREL